MTAPVTALKPLSEYRRTAAAEFIHTLIPIDPTVHADDYTHADEMLAEIAKGDDAPLTVMVKYVTGEHSARMAVVLAGAEKKFMAAAGDAHEYDELIFGGFMCLTCSPKEGEEGYGEPETTIGWPCPPLREAGVTDELATTYVREQYAAIQRRVREAHAAGAAKLPELSGFEEHNGIRVSYVGEDVANLFALGWHVNPDDVLTAFDAYARKTAGIEGVWDSATEKPQPADLFRAWAVNTGHDTYEWCLDTKDHSGDGEPRAYTHETPGAFPVTILWER